jgi:hypothetical protein
MADRLPKRLQAWYPAAHESAEHWGVNVCLILGVLDRETLGGELTKPKGSGAAGTGDFMPRPWSRYAQKPWASARLKRWLPTQEEFDAWCRTMKRKAMVPFELCAPIDGIGFGRGLMQPDWCDPDNFAFLAELMPDGTPAWKNGARNIDYGTQKLHNLIDLFGHEEGLAAAAYNADKDKIREAIAGLSSPTTPERRLRAADHLTTGGNYASDVLGRRDRFRALLTHRIPAD